jgi:hypothetical protein
MAIRINQYRALLSTGSLKAFYDDVVYWEIAKNNNKFFVTFMKGEYATPNNLQESLGTITSSVSEEKTYTYEIHDASKGSTIVNKSYTAAYFYPFSSYQLSVLRDEPTLIVNMDKESEIPDGLGDKGFVIIPQNCHTKVKNNIEYYLEKAGLIEKTTKFKNPSDRR